MVVSKLGLQAATSTAAYFAVEEEMDTNSTNATDAAGDDEAVRRTQDWSIWMMGGCMVLWGVASGTVSGPAQALYDNFDIILGPFSRASLSCNPTPHAR